MTVRDSRATERSALEAIANIGGLINRVAPFASPKLLTNFKCLPSREDVVAHLDALLDVLPHLTAPVGAEPLPDLKPHLMRLRELFAAWTPSLEVPGEITEAVRRFLTVWIGEEPAEGWDEFEGFPEDKP